MNDFEKLYERMDNIELTEQRKFSQDPSASFADLSEWIEEASAIVVFDTLNVPRDDKVFNVCSEMGDEWEEEGKINENCNDECMEY